MESHCSHDLIDGLYAGKEGIAVQHVWGVDVFVCVCDVCVWDCVWQQPCGEWQAWSFTRGNVSPGTCLSAIRLESNPHALHICLFIDKPPPNIHAHTDKHTTSPAHRYTQRDERGKCDGKVSLRCRRRNEDKWRRMCYIVENRRSMQTDNLKMGIKKEIGRERHRQKGSTWV